MAGFIGTAVLITAAGSASAAWYHRDLVDPTNSFAGEPAYGPGPDCGYYDENGAQPGYGYTPKPCHSRTHVFTGPYVRHDVWW
ncbi:MAG TPA: hypothetical protein VFB45_14485 [Pseudolabrys sp.]|nr:hypothetical protein [Pseudolabrys sp.]